MKLTKLICPTLLCLSALASPLAGANCDHNQFSLQIKQIEKQQGNFFVAIHASADTYMTKDADVFMESVLPVTRLGTQTLRICDVPEGTYAVAIYQDVNDNGKLDSNFIRIPKEPYGFSNNIDKLTPPSFEEASFEFDGAGGISINLK
jgi:uncharacterized protein (DUF2141 family)